jgi:hypothetical protein
MIVSSPFVITLSNEERSELTARANAAHRAHREVLRAKIILAAAASTPRTPPSRRRLAGLKDLPRSGRPRRFTAVEVAEVKALACEHPPTATPRWPDGAARTWPSKPPGGVVTSVSTSTVRLAGR